MTQDPAASCTKRQREVFEQIAIGQDAGHHPATLAVLERKGLIAVETEIYRQGWPLNALLHGRWLMRLQTRFGAVFLQNQCAFI